MPSIILDHREKAALLCAVLKEEHGFELEIRQLKVGDYEVGPDTVVERKTVRDFCVSLMQGRLFRQAYWLSESRQNTVLLLEGPSFTGMSAGVSLDAVRGALVTLSYTGK